MNLVTLKALKLIAQTKHVWFMETGADEINYKALFKASSTAENVRSSKATAEEDAETQVMSATLTPEVFISLMIILSTLKKV